MNKMTEPEQRKLEPWLEQIRSQVNQTAGEAHSDDATWWHLESELFPAPASRKLGKRYTRRWQAAAAVIAFLLAVSGLWLYNPHKTVMDGDTASRPMAVILDTPSHISTSEKNQTTEDAANQAVSVKSYTHSTFHHTTGTPLLAIHNAETTSTEKQTDREETSEQPHQNEESNPAVSVHRDYPSTPNHSVATQPTQLKPDGMTTMAVISSPDGDWQFSLSASNSNTASKTTETPVPMYDTAPMLFAPPDGALRSIVDDEERYQEASFHHHAPLQIGVRFFYSLSKRWRIGSGLTYTYLRSNSSATFETPTRTQQIHYLGIPLTMQYDLLHRRMWHFYVGTEARVDKCLAVRWGDFVPETNPWQFSLSGIAGIGLHLHQHLELYIEPNVGYYFDNCSPVKSLYKEQPLSIGISAGFIFK